MPHGAGAGARLLLPLRTLLAAGASSVPVGECNASATLVMASGAAMMQFGELGCEALPGGMKERKVRGGEPTPLPFSCCCCCCCL